MTIQTKKPTAYRREIYQRAIAESFIKLNPRLMVRNPVMFVVEVGSLLTTILWIQALLGQGEAPTSFIGVIVLWLWFTVLFANFSEAVAEGRGKAQAESLRKARQDTPAKKLSSTASDVQSALSKVEVVSSTALRKNDLYLVEAGDILPADGEIEAGIASVDESAVTGESAPVVREAGGDRSAVTAGTRLLSDWLIIRVSSDPGQGFLDCVKYFTGWFHDHLSGGMCHAAAIFTLQCRCCRKRDSDYDHGSGCAACLFDPHHHRWIAFRDWHCRHGPHDPAQCDRHVRPCSGSRRGCGCIAA
jgi:hypothetical protein